MAISKPYGLSCLKKDGEGVQEMSTLTTKFSNSEQWESEPLPALFLDVDDVLERQCSVVDDTAKGVTDLEPGANPTKKTVAHRVDAMKDQGRVADQWQPAGLQCGIRCHIAFVYGCCDGKSGARVQWWAFYRKLMAAVRGEVKARMPGKTVELSDAFEITRGGIH